MKQQLIVLLVGLLCAASHPAQAELNIFSCEPEWAALAKEIGGDKVNTFSATHARQDPHYIRARPSLISKARRADLILCSGAGLEQGWLPILLQKSGAAVQPGTKGFLVAADLVPILDKPKVLDRSLGDIHPEGNPHVHLNPQNVLLVARELAKRLESIDAANAAFYRDRLKDFTIRWKQAMAGWKKKAAGLQGKSVVVHHKAFSYLLDWLDMKAVASLEPKPGIPPTTSHLEGLLQQLKKRPADLIIRTPYEPDKASEWLSEKTSIPDVVLPYTVDGLAESGSLFAVFDRSISILKGAMQSVAK